MLNSVALDVVIGLVFIYLLYSLLATVLSEIIATNLGLRSQNLKQAVYRMLSDEGKVGRWTRIKRFLSFGKTPDHKVVNQFYDNPEIKYLEDNSLVKHPSSFKSRAFAKAVMDLIDNEPEKKSLEKNIDNLTQVFDPDTAKYIKGLWHEGEQIAEAFKTRLEDWFDRTMIHATEWYKRKIQFVLFLIGFCIAWSFNADTFSIVDRLATDKQAREGLIEIAVAFNQNNPNLDKYIDTTRIDSVSLTTYTERLDSLLSLKAELQTDINKANAILGTGIWLPDSVLVIQKANQTSFSPFVELGFVKPQRIACALNGQFYSKENNSCESCKSHKITQGYIYFSGCDQLHYIFWLFCHHFMGYVVTAIAISLGAPFWFDLLNKLMRLRSNSKS